MGLFDRLAKSLRASAGDIVFGMEDGTVSVFGLVSGVALSANNGQVVLLAGATGAAAAAVSMMAGSYLDAATQQDQARALPRQTEAQQGAEDAALAQRVAGRLEAAGVSTDQVAAFRGAIASTPGAFSAIRAEITPQNPMAEASPMAHALWMFVSNLFAGAVPVLPFALLPFQEARILSVLVTTALLLALGVGRGLVAGRNVLRTTLETVFVAAAAAAAGVGIGRLVT
jgi:VIT1/CCC1 family predicted Fe2+/Mn2+ transporter